MPGPRGTAVHAEHAGDVADGAKEVADQAGMTMRIWEQIWADDTCEPHERRLLEPLLLEHYRKSKQVAVEAKQNEREANQIDGVTRLVKQMLHTVRVTPTVIRTTRETIEDEAHLLEAA